MAAEENKKIPNDTTKATGTTGMENATTGTKGQDAFAATGQTNKGKDAFATTGSVSGQGVQSAKDQGSIKSDSADQLASQVGGVLRGDTGAAKGIVSQVKESGGKVAGEALGQVKEKATTKIEEQKSNLAQGLGSVADTIRQVGETIKGGDAPRGVVDLTTQYGDSLARQVESFSGYLEKHNVAEMMRDVERFARRNPALFIGGAFALGLLGARFLKSSNPNQALMPYEGGGRKKFRTGDAEVFHPHTEAELKAEGESPSSSGEGVRPF